MAARQATILFAIGSDGATGRTADGRPLYEGCTDLHRLFDKREPVHVMTLTRQMLRQQRRPDLDPYRCVLNLVTDPDQNPRALENLRKLLRGFGGRVINPPEAVARTTRDQVARLLQETPGLVVPKVVRLRNARPDLAVAAVERDGLRFPLIVRKAGTHTGMIVGVAATIDELRAAITEAGEHIITEFVDFRSADGLYRKHRVFFIGERIVFRHMLVSDQWNVHAKHRMGFMVERPHLLDEEHKMFARVEGTYAAEITRTLEAIRDRMRLDYFGMDFGITQNGRMVLFEANATMNFFPFMADPRFEYVRQCVGPARQAFHDMLGRNPALAVPPPKFQLSR
ncbi:MAG: RimK family alpha-L-glutamate ligase [Sphingomicrobium sp.]